MGMKDEIVTHFRYKSDGMIDLALDIVKPSGHVVNYDHNKYEIAGQHTADMLCNLCGPKFVHPPGKPTFVISDPVNHPDYYTAGGIETIDFLQAKLGDGFEHYLAGNIIKYITRYRHKNGVEDLKKAQWYLTKLIEVKSNEPANG